MVKIVHDWYLVICKQSERDKTMSIKCGYCKYANVEKNRFDEVNIECRRLPPTLFSSGALAKFPRVLPDWNCGEFEKGTTDYWSEAGHN